MLKFIGKMLVNNYSGEGFISIRFTRNGELQPEHTTNFRGFNPAKIAFKAILEIIESDGKLENVAFCDQAINLWLTIDGKENDMEIFIPSPEGEDVINEILSGLFDKYNEIKEFSEELVEV